MHSDVEEKFRKFIEEQTQLMEKSIPFALKVKPQFGDDYFAYIDWLNKVFQLKKVAPHLTEEQLTPAALEISTT